MCKLVYGVDCLAEEKMDTDAQDLRINHPQILRIRVHLLFGR